MLPVGQSRQSRAFERASLSNRALAHIASIAQLALRQWRIAVTHPCCHLPFRSASRRCHRQQQPNSCLTIIRQSFHCPSDHSSNQPSTPSKLRMQSRTEGAGTSTELRSQSDMLQPPHSDAAGQAPIQHTGHTQISDATAAESVQTRSSRDVSTDGLMQTDPVCQCHSSGLPEMSLRPGFREHDGNASPAQDAQANATKKGRSPRRKGRKGKLKAAGAEAAGAGVPQDPGRQLEINEPDAAKKKDNEEAETQDEIAKKHRPRPTHFLALQLSQHAEVCQAIARVQAALVKHDSLLEATLVDTAAAHLTVMVAELASTDCEGVARLECAKRAMSDLHSELASAGSLQPISVQLSCLSSFWKQVLYLDVMPGAGLDAMHSLVKAAKERLAQAGIESTDDRDFTPHVTIAKMSKVRSRRRGKQPICKAIPKEAWEDLVDVKCSPVTVAQLQLCSMQGRKAGEWYDVVHSIPLHAVEQA